MVRLSWYMARSPPCGRRGRGVPLRRAGNSAIAYHPFSHVLCRSVAPAGGPPGAQVEVLLRDYDLVLLPHVAVRLDRVRDQRHRTRPRRGLVSGRRTPSAPWHPHRSGRRA